MKLLDVVLAGVVVILWGLAFVATRLGLDALSPPQLTVLRFVIAGLPALWLVPRPLPWAALVPTGLTLFAGQFLFQFFGIASGMPPGLASVIVQTQALFTIVFAALALGERPTARQWAGTTVALAGLAAITTTVGVNLTLSGLMLTLVSPVSFGIGNVLLKGLPPVDVLRLTVWLSLVPPLPALALSVILDGPAGFVVALSRASWIALLAALYLGLVATVIAYAIWGRLLRRYSAAIVTPFALLVPFVAAGASALVFGEQFGGTRLLGVGLVLFGIAVIVLPLDRVLARRDAERTAIERDRGPRSTALATRREAIVSPATRRDAPSVIALIARVFTEYGFVWDPKTEVPDLLDFGAHYKGARGAFFVVRQGGRVVGSVGVEQLDGATAELHRLYVDPEWRRQGLGEALVGAVLAWCRARTLGCLVLWSDTRFEDAHRLYIRLGFRQDGERSLPADINQTREYRFERTV